MHFNIWPNCLQDIFLRMKFCYFLKYLLLLKKNTCYSCKSWLKCWDASWVQHFLNFYFSSDLNNLTSPLFFFHFHRFQWIIIEWMQIYQKKKWKNVLSNLFGILLYKIDLKFDLKTLNCSKMDDLLGHCIRNWVPPPHTHTVKYLNIDFFDNLVENKKLKILQVHLIFLY